MTQYHMTAYKVRRAQEALKLYCAMTGLKAEGENALSAAVFSLISHLVLFARQQGVNIDTPAIGGQNDAHHYTA